MGEGGSLSLRQRECLNFGKTYIKWSIFLNGVLCSK
jgi:hypothetical protein